MFSQALLHGSSLPEGGVTIGDEKSMPGLLEAAALQGFLAVQLPTPGPSARASLSLHIEEAIEVSLGRRGAAAPGVGASVDLDASLSDQLYRARLIEFRGIALGIPNLEGITNLAGTLDAEDSQTLKWWFEAAGERPLLLFVDEANSRHSVYPAPVPFARLLSPADDGSREAPRATAPEQAASSAAMDLSEPPPQVASGESLDSTSEDVGPDLDAPDLDAPDEEPSVTELDEDLLVALRDGHEPSDTVFASADDETDESASVSQKPEASDPLAIEAPPAQLLTTDALAASLLVVEEAIRAPSLGEALEISSLDDSAAPDTELDGDGDDDAPTAVYQQAPVAGREETRKNSRPGPVVVEHLAKRMRDAKKPSSVHAEFARVASEQWQNWVEELDATRGPKPLAVVERTFVSAYVPLREAHTQGIAGERAREPLSTFATSFEQSYSEAFDALRVRGKRPTMVLDVPDIAQRVGRLHGARSIQLLLVDAMRFDLGLRIQDRLRVLARGNASLAERLLLWSALPTTTAQQLDLIGKGPAGLREPSTVSDTSPVVARGKSATTLRRIKAAHREIYKLDVVQARLDGPGEAEPQRLDAIADEAAEAIANHFLKLPPRTLVMMFGDHGFLLDPLDDGTTAARSGGASPEEVLVPAFAWLIGNVH